MAEQAAEKTTKASTTGAESPTTAREPDFDDDPHDSSNTLQPERQSSPAPKRVSFQEVVDEDAPPPAKPPRPLSPQVQAENTLIEAFPSVDSKVVKAVLVASGYKVEPAFNALLSMSDPDYVAEEQPPAPPPRPAQGQRTMSQLESDEMYARQLAEHYSGTTGFGSRGRGDPPLPRRRQGDSLKPSELYDDRDRSFFDDDLPVIKQNIQKGFQETQVKVNKWIMDFKKKLDGDEDDYDNHTHPAGQSSSQAPPRQDFGPSQSEQLRGIRRSAEQGRRSGDRERYDADPRVLSDDFTQLELHENEGGPPRRTSSRPLANPDLFKSAPTGGPVDEVEALYSNPNTSNRQPSPSAGKGGKKWQPLTSVAPNPESEDNDPFSLGDSDEEEAKKTDLKPEDTERLKKSASVSEEHGRDKAELKEAAQSGSKNKVAEDLLKGKS